MLDVKKTLGKILVAIQGLTYTAQEAAYLDYCKVRRVGNVVNIWGQSTGSWGTGADTYKALTTLPTWARPSHVIVDTVEAFGDATNQISIQIGTDGVVYLYCRNDASWWRYNVTYLLG